MSGHNGCGKTMLLRLICGLIKPTKGQIDFDRDYRFGVIIENPTFFMNETAMYNLKYLAAINNLISDDTIFQYLKKFNLYEFRNKQVRTFSLGMKQRLAICQAFMENPDVILLDKPFNAIDDENLEIVYRTINESKENNKIIVIASHGLISEDCAIDSIIEMREGRVIKVS